ncbi:hypothetical protein Q1695_013138 [Nippostrongylus brasiliensis]|nr:hypothetical protein Q1695_013138 [Nippostrongylus brasiliensis]
MYGLLALFTVSLFSSTTACAPINIADMTTTTTTTTTAITPQNRRIFTANTGTLIANDIKPTKRVKRSLEPIIVTVVSDEPYDPTKNEQNFKTAESLLTDLAKSQGVVYNEEDVKAKMKKQGGKFAVEYTILQSVDCYSVRNFVVDAKNKTSHFDYATVECDDGKYRFFAAWRFTPSPALGFPPVAISTAMAPANVVVFGSIIEDLTSYTERFPRPGETVFGSGFLSSGGGKGANQAVAAARLGAHVTLLAKVGDDALGEESIERLRNYGVNVDKIEKSSTASTGVASITVDAQGEYKMVVSLGANVEMDESAANRHADALDGADVVIALATVRQAGNRKIFELARKKGVCTICNPAPTYRCEDRSFLQLVDILCLNRMEAQNVSGLHVKDIEEAKEAVKVIQAMGPQRVVVTMGADGCVYSNGNEEPCHVAIPQVEVVDTTGAGDCFCGSLAFFVAQNRRKCRLPDWSQLGDAIKKAALISSLAVTRRGAQSSFLSREEVLKGYPDIFD